MSSRGLDTGGYDHVLAALRAVDAARPAPLGQDLLAVPVSDENRGAR